MCKRLILEGTGGFCGCCPHSDFSVYHKDCNVFIGRSQCDGGLESGAGASCLICCCWYCERHAKFTDGTEFTDGETICIHCRADYPIKEHYRNRKINGASRVLTSETPHYCRRCGHFFPSGFYRKQLAVCNECIHESSPKSSSNIDFKCILCEELVVEQLQNLDFSQEYFKCQSCTDNS